MLSATSVAWQLHFSRISPEIFFLYFVPVFCSGVVNRFIKFRHPDEMLEVQTFAFVFGKIYLSPIKDCTGDS